jgi:RNA polymerase sigma factor (sigma-70 family)
VEDQFLIPLLKAGDEKAYRDLVRIYYRRVYATCLGIVQDVNEAEDAAQEIFIEVFRSVKNFREDAKLSTWLYRIAVNRSLDLVRSGKRKGKIVQIDGEVEGKLTGEHAFIHPGAALEEKEKSRLLYEAIDALPENQKAAFTLSRIEGMTQKEVAEALEIKEGAVESLLQRAKQNLRKMLVEYYSGDDRMMG